MPRQPRLDAQANLHHGMAARARAGIAYLWVKYGGHPARPLAAVLGVSPQAVYQAVARGRVDRALWERLLTVNG
jgi:hypothetical protein